MKRIILSILLAIITTSMAFADDCITPYNFQKKINTIGYSILNANRIEHGMAFGVMKPYDVSQARSKNLLTNTIGILGYEHPRDTGADMVTSTRIISISPTIMAFVDRDDELAAIIAHQISHCEDTYHGAFKGYVSALNYWVSPKKYDLKADKRAVDYLVNAGYNPCAIIVMLNKMEKHQRYDTWWSRRVIVSRRMMKVYEYIYTKYPSVLIDNDYKENIYYQNFLLISRGNRAKLNSYIEEGKNLKNIKYE